MSAQPKITVHHLDNSRSSRILWMLEELNLPYSIKEYKRNEDMRAPQELKDVHPLGKAPVVTIEEDGKTLTLPESGSIVEWILTRYGPQLLPASTDVEASAQHMFYMHYAEGSLMGPLLQLLMFSIIPQRSPALMRPVSRMMCNGIVSQAVNPAFKKNFTFLESELKKAGGEFFVGGKLTGADIMLSFPIAAIAGSTQFQNDYPGLYQWIKKMEERPAYKTSIEKGGLVDYSHLLQ